MLELTFNSCRKITAHRFFWLTLQNPQSYLSVTFAFTVMRHRKLSQHFWTTVLCYQDVLLTQVEFNTAEFRILTGEKINTEIMRSLHDGLAGINREDSQSQAGLFGQMARMRQNDTEITENSSREFIVEPVRISNPRSRSKPRLLGDPQNKQGTRVQN